MMNWNNLGTVLRCPHCKRAFDPATCKVSNDPYYDLYGPARERQPGGDTPDAAFQRQWVWTEQFQATAWDAPEAETHIKCGNGKCGRIEPMAGWMLEHKFDDPTWPDAVAPVTDNSGARPSPAQQRIAERTASLEALAEELSPGTKKPGDS